MVQLAEKLLSLSHEALEVSLAERQKATLGLYFHIPFCPHLCPYCDFIKTDRFSRRDVLGYQEWLQHELDDLLQKDELQEHKVVTVYFGGGTPGLLWGSAYRPLIERISSRWEIEECTLEANPNMTSRAKILSWREAGINRLTLGVQSLNSQLLVFLGRRHSPSKALESLSLARESGFDNVVVDLIYGLPRSAGERDIRDEARQLERMGATGLSLYALTIEDSTDFGARGVRPDDDAAVSEYAVLRELCAEFGYVQRETSNFSRFETKHNNIYWHGQPYYGIGSGAHGLLGPAAQRPFGQRYRYGPAVDDTSRQQSRPGRDELSLGLADSAYLQRFEEPPRTWQELFHELSFSLFRTPTGIPGSWMAAFERGGLDWSRLDLDPLISRGFEEGHLARMSDGGIRLSPDEMIRGDYWHSRLVLALGTLS